MSVAFTPRASDLPEPAAEQYRVISSLAVVSFVVGLLSALALFDWMLGFIPMIGIGCGALALLRIRSRPEELTGEAVALVGTLLSTLFLTVAWGWFGYEYLTEVPPDAMRISYSQLQPLESSPTEVPPASAKVLDGKRVFIAGYVYPTSQRTGLQHFVLCRDNGTCCFGGKPKLTDMIEVTLRPPLKLDYSTRLHKLSGVFRVQTVQSSDDLGSVLYQLEADYLK
jgi:hypothetical protein